MTTRDIAADRRRLILGRRIEFSQFAKPALRELVGTVDHNWHIDALTYMGQRIAIAGEKRAIISAPPRAFKSMLMSSCLPAFILGRDPKKKIIVVTYGDVLSTPLAQDSRRIMDAGFFKDAFPNFALKSRSLNMLRTTAGGYRMATSVGGAVTGIGADVIIVDDMLKADSAESDLQREKSNEWLRSSLMSRFDNPNTGQMVIVAQRLHQDDIVGQMLEQGGWNHLNMSAIAEEEQTYDLGFGRRYVRPVGELLQPRRDRIETYTERQITLGERRFSAQYQQDPTPADGLIFKRAWLNEYQGPYIRQPGDRIVQSWDAASKGGEGNDFSVCITAAVRRSQVVIVDVFRARLDFPSLKRAVIDQARTYNATKLLIEDAAAGIQLIQVLQAEQPAKVPLPIAVKPVTNKIERALVASARVEFGALLLPDKAPWLGAFVTELTSFPGGRHDDQVDALAHLMANTQNDAMPRFAPGITFTAGTREPDLMHQMIGQPRY